MPENDTKWGAYAVGIAFACVLGIVIASWLLPSPQAVLAAISDQGGND
jgi:hypothetical protein